MRRLLLRVPAPLIVLAGMATPLMALPPSDAAPAKADFMEAASAEGWFSQFVALIRKAGLAEKLNAEPVTVFIPTTAAFERLTPKQRRGILSLSPDLTRQFVEHYVVPGPPLKSNDIDKSVKTMDGATFDLAWVPGQLSLRSRGDAPAGKVASVFYGDIPAGHGVIDVIDAVFIPPAIQTAINTGSGDASTASNLPSGSLKSGSGQGRHGASPAVTPPPATPPKASGLARKAPPAPPAGQTRPAPAGSQADQTASIPASQTAAGADMPAPEATKSSSPDASKPAGEPVSVPSKAPSPAADLGADRSAPAASAGSDPVGSTPDVAAGPNSGSPATAGAPAPPPPGATPSPGAPPAPARPAVSAAPSNVSAAATAAAPNPAAASNVSAAATAAAPTPATPSASSPRSPAPPVQPQVSVTARALADWKVQLSDSGKTGSVDRIMVGLSSGQLTGISARFNTIFGFGGRRVYIPWSLVTPDLSRRVLKIRMTSAEMKAAPSNPTP